MLKKHPSNGIYAILLSPLSSYRYGGQIIFVVTLAVIALLGDLALSLPAHAQQIAPFPTYSNYHCTDSEGHCYAEEDWYGNASGAATAIQLGFITCGTCDGFIDNEMWLSDQHSSQCTGVQPFKECWVEAGYSTYTATDTDPSSCVSNSAANCYYWADVRPHEVFPYSEHVIANIPLGDYGTNTTFKISFGNRCYSLLRDRSGPKSRNLECVYT